MNKASNSRSIKESIAKLEEQLFEAEKIGNTRQARAIRLVLKRLKKDSGDTFKVSKARR